MAFCIRSERKMDYFKKDSSNPGPGQYFQQVEKNVIKKRIHPPFHTSALRNTFVPKEDIPGPGSYDLIDKSIINEDSKLNINSINQNEKEIKYNSKINNYEKKYNNNLSMANLKNVSNIDINNTSRMAEVSTVPYNNNSSINQKNMSVKNNSKFIQEYNNVNYSTIKNSSSTSKLGFFSQSLRFDENNSLSKIDEPGPGTYETIDFTNNILLKNNKKKYTSEHKLMKASLKGETGSLNRVISIPSKVMNGYMYIANKNINSNNLKFKKGNINKDYKQIIDRNSPFGPKTSTNEFVGPGSYDIFIKEKGNSVLQWSKSFNVKDINLKKELFKKKQVFDEMKKYGETNNSFNKSKKISILNLLKKNPIDKYKKTLYDINNKKPDYSINKKLNSYYCRDSFIEDKSEIPGPGYYSKELINYEEDEHYGKQNEKFDQKLIKSNFRKSLFGEETKSEGNFGSNCNRFLSKSKSMEDLGPATYFKQSNKFEPNKKPDIFKHLKKPGKSLNAKENQDLKDNGVKNEEKLDNNLSRTKSMFLSKTLSDYPGPGSYEISQTFILPSFSRAQMMNSQVERFPQKEEDTPGPGSYLNNEIIETEKIEEQLKKMSSNYEDDIEKIQRIEKIKEINRRRNDFPGVGTYNPGLIETINYKMKSKLNPNQSYQSPFLISSGRFKIEKNKSVSPTIYDPYKYEQDQKKLQYMMFGKAKRFDENLNNENMKGVWHLAGPGSYDLTKDNWNKKTFNVLFSGTQ